MEKCALELFSTGPQRTNFEFTDWSQVHRMFRCGENAILRQRRIIAPLPPRYLGLICIASLKGAFTTNKVKISTNQIGRRDYDFIMLQHLIFNQDISYPFPLILILALSCNLILYPAHRRGIIINNQLLIINTGFTRTF